MNTTLEAVIKIIEDRQMVLEAREESIKGFSDMSQHQRFLLIAASTECGHLIDLLKTEINEQQT